MEYILDNIENYLPEDKDHTFDEAHEKLLKLGFNDENPRCQYIKKSIDKEIWIHNIEYRENKLMFNVDIVYDGFYFRKLNKTSPENISGWVDLDSLIKYAQHYTMPGLDEQIKRMKKLMS